jgi:hypothetical protein
MKILNINVGINFLFFTTSFTYMRFIHFIFDPKSIAVDIRTRMKFLNILFAESCVKTAF